MILPIGLSRAGEVWIDIRSFPHLLIAGTTGAGKSNLGHLLLTHLAHFDNLKLFIIDLKRMEFNGYVDHAATAFKTDTALKMLRYLRKELDYRMDLLSEARVNNIKRYKGELPYYVVFIDELSQLSPILAVDDEEKKKRKECQQYLIDLICLARAVGIHIVVSTQRPDKDILHPQLKANIPASVVFKVRNSTNSHICLDNDKAATLPNDLPGRAIYQFDVERQVQTYFMGDDPCSLLPKIPKTKPIFEEEKTEFTVC